jgi:hypothetical protein
MPIKTKTPAGKISFADHHRVKAGLLPKAMMILAVRAAAISTAVAPKWRSPE